MPTTDRGYPYETPADEPGWSLTGGSTGASAILAQVVDGDVGAIATRVTTAETNIATNTSGLAAHIADTTGVHGIADTAALVVTTDPRMTDARTPTAHAASHAAAGSDPLTPAAIGAYPATGGTVAGDITLTENKVTVRSTDGLNAWRAAAAAGVVAVGYVGVVDAVLWSGADFTGTPTPVSRTSVTGTDLGGVTGFGTLGAPEQFVHGTGLYAKLGGKNDAEPVQFCGRMTTPGAPAAGTWDTGDLVVDSAGVWHLCTAGGTPGTWT